MDEAAKESGSPEIGRLILALAKAFHWAGLYGSNHPVLAKRVGETHASLLACLASEPGGELLLGIARDKVLYRDMFLGAGQDLVVRLTESLYLRQVATLGFGPEVRPEELISLFRYLHESQGAAVAPPPEEFLRREGIRGIRLSPYNYKEMLSRTLVEQQEKQPDARMREDELWRILLTSDLADDQESESKLLQEIVEYPELFRAILSRARAADGRKAPSASAPPGEALSSEVLRRILQRTGMLVKNLPEDRKREILAALASGSAPGGGEAEEGDHPVDILMTRSLTAEFSDDEFLDIFATILRIEGKAGDRIRKTFEILAADRNAGGTLAAKAGERLRESRKAKAYYDLKTWETIEKLLLARSESAYLGSDHSRFLETITAARKPYADRLKKGTAVDPSLLAFLNSEEMRRRTTLIQLELLAAEREDGEFFDLLEEVRKVLPNLVSRKEILLLLTVLRRLGEIQRESPEARRAAIQDIVQGIDFGQIADLALSGDTPMEAKECIPDLLSSFAEAATGQVLDRLLTEPDAANRRALLRLAAHLGPTGVPEMIERLSHPKWYFVRNLCILLGEAGDRRALSGLLRAASHSDLRVRREALQAIGKLGAQEAVPSLGKTLLQESFFSSVKEDQLRIDAASALYRIGGTEAVAFLHRGKGSRREAVRRHCEELLRSADRVP